MKTSRGMYKSTSQKDFEFVPSAEASARKGAPPVYQGNDGYRSKEELVNYLAQANQQKDLKTLKEREKIGQGLEVEACTFTPAIINYKVPKQDLEDENAVPVFEKLNQQARDRATKIEQTFPKLKEWMELQDCTFKPETNKAKTSKRKNSPKKEEEADPYYQKLNSIFAER